MINLDTNFISVVQPLWIKMNGHCKYDWNFSKSKEHNSLKNCLIIPKRYSYDKSGYQIPFQYVRHLRRKWTETVGRSSKREMDSSKAIYHPFSKGDINIKHRVDLYRFNNSNAHKTDGQLIIFSCSKWHWYF